MAEGCFKEGWPICPRALSGQTARGRCTQTGCPASLPLTISGRTPAGSLPTGTPPHTADAGTPHGSGTPALRVDDAPPRDLIHPNRGHSCHFPLIELPVDRHPHCRRHTWPVRTQLIHDHLPRQPLRPLRQVPLVFPSLRRFSHGPRDLLDPEPAALAAHPPHPIHEKYSEAPQWLVFELSLLLVAIPRASPTAPQTHRMAASPGFDSDQQPGGLHMP